MAVSPPPSLPSPSALQTALDNANAKTPNEALPLEILHNLRYQHNWTNVSIVKPHSSAKDSIPDLKLSSRSPLQQSSSPTLLTGIPPKSIYIHPSYQAQLILHKITLETLTPQTEYIFPLTLGQAFTLRTLQAAFDSIPERDPIEMPGGELGGRPGLKHQDAKRILMAMRGRQGVGGDGTVNYYIVQEGEVKPRQN